MLEFLSGGFYKATIHRVVQPPPDQRQYARLGVFYFATPDEEVTLAPATASPVLKRVGIKKRLPEGTELRVQEYRKARVAAYGHSVLKKGNENNVEEEIINGVLVKHYN